MRVLVVTNFFPPEFLGGYELGCAQMTEALRAAGHEIHVVTSVSAKSDGPSEEGVARVLELPPIYSVDRMSGFAPPLQEYFHLQATAVNPANARALGEVVTAVQPDVAYLWNLLGVGGLGVLALLKFCGIPWVWHIMDQIPRQLTRFGTTGPHVPQQLNRIFPGRYIMCSSHVLGEIRLGDVDLGTDVHIIPNWVTGDPPRERDQWYRGGHLRIVHSAGNLGEEKGTHILIEAAAQLRDQGYGNFTIDLYGREGDYRLRRMLYDRRVEHLVRLMGPRQHDELRRLYEAYDAFAFPTWAREPFGFVGIEAAVAGCVPVMTDDCGLAEWMIAGVDCLKAPRTAEGFANAFAKILNGDTDLRALGRRAQATVWKHFHISEALRRVEPILSEAAADRRAAEGDVDEFSRLARFAEGLLLALLAEAK